MVKVQGSDGKILQKVSAIDDKNNVDITITFGKYRSVQVVLYAYDAWGHETYSTQELHRKDCKPIIEYF